jgi:hypothetical protein
LSLLALGGEVEDRGEVVLLFLEGEDVLDYVVSFVVCLLPFEAEVLHEVEVFKDLVYLYFI